MDQPLHEYLPIVWPSDLKRVPMYLAPASQDVNGNEVYSQTPFYLVPASAIGDPSRVAAADSYRDRSSNLENVRDQSVYGGSVPSVYESIPYGGRPLAIEVPANNAAEMQGRSRAAPTMVCAPLQRVRQAQLPGYFTVPRRPSAGENNFLHPRYDEDQMWVPRQIPSQFPPRPTGNLRHTEDYAHARRPEFAPLYLPSNSSTQHYGYPVPKMNFEGRGPIVYQPYTAHAHDYVDPQHSSWRIPAQRGRLEPDEGTLREDREMYPAYNLIPRTDVGASIPHRSGDGYYLVRGPGSFPVADDGYNGASRAIDRGAYRLPAKQASIVPVNFPVSDLAKIKTSSDGGDDQPPSNLFYDPASGKIFHDPQHITNSSSPFASTRSRAEDAPIRVGSESAQSAYQLDNAYRGKERLDRIRRSSASTSAPDVAGEPTEEFPIESLLPAIDSPRDPKVSGGGDTTGLWVPNISRLIPTMSTSTTPNDIVDDDQSSRISDPFYLVKPSLQSEKAKDVADGRSGTVDGGAQTSSPLDAAVNRNESAKTSGHMYYRPLAASDKIKEVFEVGSSGSGRSFVVTRTIPVLSPDVDHLQGISKNSQNRDAGLAKEAVSSDHVAGTPKNTGVKDPSEKSKNVGAKKPENPKEAVCCTGRTSKQNTDLMANIGRAIWSSKPKERNAVSGQVSGADKSASQEYCPVRNQKHVVDLLPDVGKSTWSYPSENSPEWSNSSSKMKEKTYCDSEKGGITKNSNGGLKLSQETEVIQADRKCKDLIPEVIVGEGIAVHEKLHPNVSITQEQECGERASKAPDAEAAIVNTDKAETGACSEDMVTSVARGGALVEEEARGEFSDDQVLLIDRQKPTSLPVDEAATKIQARYKGHVVRNSDLLKPLRTIKKDQQRLQSLQSQVRTSEDVSHLRANPNEGLKISETAMGLLLELDTLQGVHPFVREMRKYVAREVVKFQDRFDAAMKGELVLPSANRSAAEAGASVDSGEVVADSEAHSEETVDDSTLVDRDSNPYCEFRESAPGAEIMSMTGGDGSAPHVVDQSGVSIVADAPTKEDSEVHRGRGVETSPVDQDGSDAPKKEISSVLRSGDENIVISCVGDRPVDEQSGRINREEPSPSSNPVSIPSFEVTGGLTTIDDELEVGKYTDTPSHQDNVNSPETSETVLERGFADASECSTVSVPVEKFSTLVNMKDDCQVHGSLYEPVESSTDDESLNKDSSSVSASTVEGSVAYDSVKEEVANTSATDLTLGGSEQTTVPPTPVGGKSGSGVRSSEHTTSDETLQHPQQDCGFEVANTQDLKGENPTAAELQSASGNESQELEDRLLSEIELVSGSLSHHCHLPSDDSETAYMDDDHGDPKVSREVNLKIRVDERAEAVSGNHDVPSRDSPSGIKAEVDGGTHLSTEEAEVFVKDDENASSHPEGEVSKTVPDDTKGIFAAMKEQDGGAPGAGESSQNKTAEHLSEASVKLHDSSHLASKENEVACRENEMEMKIPDAIIAGTFNVFLATGVNDGGLDGTEETKSDAAQPSSEKEVGGELGEFDGFFLSTDKSKFVPRDNGDILTHLEVKDHESFIQSTLEILEEKCDDFAAAKTVEPSIVEPEGIHEISTPFPSVKNEMTSRLDDDVPLKGDMSNESWKITDIEYNEDAATEILGTESESSQFFEDSSSGETLGVDTVPSPLPDEGTGTKNSSECRSDMKMVREVRVTSPLPAENSDANSRNVMMDRQLEVVANKKCNWDETSVATPSKRLEEEDVGGEIFRSPLGDNSCNSSYHENVNSDIEQEGQYNVRIKNSIPENQDTLLKQLTEENRRLQNLFREVIQNSSDQKTVIQEMLGRLEKLEQLVKEQYQRKEKRRKNKKLVRHGEGLQ